MFVTLHGTGLTEAWHSVQCPETIYKERKKPPQVPRVMAIQLCLDTSCSVVLDVSQLTSSESKHCALFV